LLFFWLFRLLCWLRLLRLDRNLFGFSFGSIFRSTVISFLFIARRLIYVEGVSNGIKLELPLLQLFSFEAAFDCLDMGEVSSEFFFSVERYDVGFSLSGFVFRGFSDYFSDGSRFGGCNFLFLFLWLLGIRWIFVTWDIVPPVYGWH
jgi:hypothetical protein